MRVRVETRSRLTHPTDEVDRRDASLAGPRPGDPARHASAAVGGLDAEIPGVEDAGDVRPRRRRPQPDRLVRLVPHDPLRDERVALRRREREALEVLAAQRSHVGRVFGVRPAGSPPKRDDGLEPAGAKRVQQPVAPAPAVIPFARLGAVPVERDPHDVEAEPVELRDAIREPSGPNSSHASSWMPNCTPAAPCADPANTPTAHADEHGPEEPHAERIPELGPTEPITSKLPYEIGAATAHRSPAKKNARTTTAYPTSRRTPRRRSSDR